MAPQLKPCPFCGGAAHVVEISSGRRVEWYSVSCDDIWHCIAGDPMKYYPTEGQAVRAWNRRARPAADAAAPADAPTLQPLMKLGA